MIGSSVTVIQQSIINGQQCLSNESESAVELFINAEVSFGSLGTFKVASPFCAGTLIAPDVVLTAAHCLDPSELTHGFGTVTKLEYYITTIHDLSAYNQGESLKIPSDAVRALSWTVQDEYDAQTMEGPGPHNFKDIGLVFLSKPVGIKPAVVITKDEAKQIIAGKSVTIAGWGQRVADTTAVDDQNMQVDGQKYCASSEINELSAHEMQIGSNQESSRKCFGDSGGPTYMEVMTPNGPENRVIGVTSHAYDDAICMKGGIDTRVDAWLDWVDSKMREACQSKTRSWCEVEGLILPDYAEEPTSISAQISGFMQRLLAYLLSWLS